jgi:TonB dependent receptor/TonB-dependent Receptor Plug Domain
MRSKLRLPFGNRSIDVPSPRTQRAARWLTVFTITLSAWLLWTRDAAAADNTNATTQEPTTTPPRLLAHPPVPYPKTLTGDAEVVMTLELSATGRVVTAVADDATSPFARFATDAAQSWSFAPARHGELAVSAKIRVLVRFEDERPSAAERLAHSEHAERPDAAVGTVSSDIPSAEVVVYGVAPDLKTTLTRAEVRTLPGAFGDPFRAIETLPGVTPMVSGLPYFYVRGAPPGNVGYVFDGIPMPLLYHVAAGPGVIEPSLIDSVELYPGAYPAAIGRFTGGVVAGKMAEPQAKLRGRATLRLVDAGGMLEVPFADGRGDLTLAGRYSYTAAVLSLVSPDIKLSYWDYQARLRFRADPTNQFELLAFGAADYLGQRSGDKVSDIVNLAFHRYDLRWDHRIGTPLRPGNLRTAFTLGFDRTTGNYYRGVRALNSNARLRSEFTQRLSKHVGINAGADVQVDFLSLTATGEGSGFGPQATQAQALLTGRRQDGVIGAYLETNLQVTRRIRVNPGLRVDLFDSEGHSELGVDPRLSASFKITPRATVNYGFGIAHQPPSFLVAVPGVQPSLRGGLQTAIQNSAGLDYQFPISIQGSVTLFHNVFLKFSDPISTSRLDDHIPEQSNFETRTQGRSFGIELALRRDLSQRLSGFVSYTLSRSERSFAQIHGPALFDRTHVLNIALSYDFGNRWRLGSRVVYYSGMPALVAYAMAAVNPPRSTPFWRLDWRLEKRWPVGDQGASLGLVAEVLNTTLNKEVLEESCNAYACRAEGVGPVTVPSLGLEGDF